MKLSEIVELLSPFLTSHGEKPILAVLGGSRGCNFESKDSDYDINFYYSSPSVLWESARYLWVCGVSRSDNTLVSSFYRFV